MVVEQRCMAAGRIDEMAEMVKKERCSLTGREDFLWATF
jgi:hypothetical protein